MTSSEMIILYFIFRNMRLRSNVLSVVLFDVVM